MDDETTGGLGFLGILGIVFVVLKLTGVIGWSWWWVTLPFWGGFALAFLILLAFFLFIAVKAYRNARSKQDDKPR